MSNNEPHHRYIHHLSQEEINEAAAARDPHIREILERESRTPFSRFAYDWATLRTLHGQEKRDFFSRHLLSPVLICIILAVCMLISVGVVLQRPDVPVVRVETINMGEYKGQLNQLAANFSDSDPVLGHDDVLIDAQMSMTRSRLTRQNLWSYLKDPRQQRYYSGNENKLGAKKEGAQNGAQRSSQDGGQESGEEGLHTPSDERNQQDGTRESGTRESGTWGRFFQGFASALPRMRTRRVCPVGQWVADRHIFARMVHLRCIEPLPRVVDTSVLDNLKHSGARFVDKNGKITSNIEASYGLDLGSAPQWEKLKLPDDACFGASITQYDVKYLRQFVTFLYEK